MIASLLLSAIAFAAPSKEFLADLELFKDRSLLLKTEHGRLDASHSALLSRLFQLTPAVTVAAGKTESKVRSDSLGTTVKSTSDYWRIGADWNLFRGLSDYHAWRAAGTEEKAQEFQIRSQELRTELEGSKVIFNWLFLHDSSNAQDELLKLKQETMRIGRDRYSQGKVSLQDVAKMELDLALQQNVVRQSEISLAENEVAYKAFFVDSLKTAKWPLAENQELALGDGGGSFSTLQLKEKANSLNSTWLANRARHLPSLDLSLAYKESPFKTPNTGTYSGAIELSFPLWSRYETSSASAAAYSGYLAAENEAATAEREEALRREFLKKKIALSSANMKEARLNLEKSDKLYRDMLRSFQLGRLSTNDLFQEQDRRIRALLSYTSSRLAFHESVMEACVLWGLSASACLR